MSTPTSGSDDGVFLVLIRALILQEPWNVPGQNNCGVSSLYPPERPIHSDERRSDCTVHENSENTAPEVFATHPDGEGVLDQHQADGQRDVEQTAPCVQQLPTAFGAEPVCEVDRQSRSNEEQYIACSCSLEQASSNQAYCSSPRDRKQSSDHLLLSIQKSIVRTKSFASVMSLARDVTRDIVADLALVWTSSCSACCRSWRASRVPVVSSYGASVTTWDLPFLLNLSSITLHARSGLMPLP